MFNAQDDKRQGDRRNNERRKDGDSSPDTLLTDLKKEIHNQLISGMDLSAVGTLNEAELREELRRGAEELCNYRSELIPQQTVGRDRIVRRHDTPWAVLVAQGFYRVFGVGRAAGWVAHALEQYEADYVVRPRARYAGGPSEGGT